MGEVKTVDLGKKYLDTLIRLLQDHLPGRIVWLYGSRANGNAYESSDIDLLFFPPHYDNSQNNLILEEEKMKELNLQLKLKSIFQNSNLPIFVDILSWVVIPQSFKEEILNQNYMLISTI